MNLPLPRNYTQDPQEGIGIQSQVPNTMNIKDRLMATTETMQNMQISKNTDLPQVHSDQEILDSLINEFGNLRLFNWKYTVFISAPYMMPNVMAFKKFFELCQLSVMLPDTKDYGRERLEESDLLDRYLGKYDIALIGDDRYTSNVIENFNSTGRRLLGLMKWGTGIDSIDQIAANRFGIVIRNTPDAFSEPVAESILGAILAFNRTLLTSTMMMQEIRDSWVKIPGKTFRETSFGIIGLGNVGRAILNKLRILGATKIKGYDIQPEVLHPDEKIYKADSLNEVLDSQPDFLIIACSLTTENRKMIGIPELKRLSMGKTVLINMARGSLIDESALIKALEHKDNLKLAGAALDVFWDEPLPQDSPLRRLDNVILTSHNANSSPHYWLKVHLNTVRNTLNVLQSHDEKSII